MMFLLTQIRAQRPDPHGHPQVSAARVWTRASSGQSAGVDTNGWDPSCAWPRGLVAPVPVDPSGQRGPTRGQAQRGRWRRVAPERYVPADARDCVEQRILEQAVRVDTEGAVTGWASLRAQGAAYFDGSARDGSRLPVPLLSSRQLASTSSSSASRARLRSDEVVVAQGIRCARAERAVSDEIKRIGELREAVVAVDMACAARVTSLLRLRRYAEHRLRGARMRAAYDRARRRTEDRRRWTLDPPGFLGGSE